MYPKLVRNRIPDIIRASGRNVSIHIARRDEYRDELYKKLDEEVKEITESPSIEEAADLFEVFLAICKVEGWSLDELEKERVDKAEAKGSFDNRIIIDAVL